MNRSSRAVPFIGAAVIATAAVAACDPPTTGPQPEPASFEVVGDAQTGTAGEPLPQPVVVTLLSDEGAPMPRWTLEWAVVAGDGSLQTAETVTDPEGRSENAWTLGGAAGAQRISVTVSGESVSRTVTATAAAGAPATVVVSPDSTSIPAGGTQQLSAAVSDAFGNQVTGAAIAWTSSPMGVATVDGSGLVAGAGAGVAEITATAGTAVGSARIVVRAGATVEISPAADTLDALGQQTALTAAVHADGGVVTDPTLTWSSSAPDIASVDADGVVTARAVGSAEITADYQGGAADTATIVVRQITDAVLITPHDRTLQVGTTDTFKAEARDANGHAIPGAAYQWTSTNQAVATIAASAEDEATISAQELGTAGIRATSEGVTGEAPLTVIEEPVADSVVVRPAVDTLEVAATVQLALDAWTGDGTPLTDLDVGWTSSDPDVASVDGNGLVTGVAPGRASIRGAVHGIADSAIVAVVAANGLLSTAFASGALKAEAAAGGVVAIPIRLDMSRASPDGDLGSVQLELDFDPTVMAYDSAAVLAGGVANSPAAGLVSYAFAASSPQGSADVLLVTLYFTVGPDVAAGVRTGWGMTYTAAPSDTDVNDYADPVVLTGSLRVTP